MKRLAYHPFFIRLFHWEYWPFHIVYGPLYFYWLWLCLRARSFFFFNTSNPGIENGGFLMESKWKIYELLPQSCFPKTVFIRSGATQDEIIEQMKKKGLNYPLVGKPDIGMQGLSVKKLHTEAEVIGYAVQSKVDFLIQEFVPFENEVGIFYYRYPGERKGKISGIVSKEFVTVTGNGQSTLEELLKKEKRFVLQLKTLKKTLGEKMSQVLPDGQKEVVVPYGNHVRGAKFIDASHLIDEDLVQAMDAVCSQVDGFYYGRLDVRYNTWEELKNGKNFSIIELNGAGSEPTHIYDPRHSVFFAWKEIIRHWNILFRISRMNHRKNKIPFMTTSSGLKMFRDNKAYVKLIAVNSNDIKRA